jgi:adenylylsulfate kinase-like enzyme
VGEVELGRLPDRDWIEGSPLALDERPESWRFSVETNGLDRTTIGLADDDLAEGHVARPGHDTVSAQTFRDDVCGYAAPWPVPPGDRERSSSGSWAGVGRRGDSTGGLLDTRVVEDLQPVLLLSGPSGSGKSTTARAWADTRLETTAWIDCDAVRGFIRAGYARPDVSFDDEAERQWMLAARISAHMARAYLQETIRCVVDAYAPPTQEPDLWDDQLAGLTVTRVHLFPTFDVCRQRNAQRTGNDRLTDEALHGNYSGYAWCIERAPNAYVIDNTSLSIEETVAELERMVTTRRASGN